MKADTFLSLSLTAAFSAALLVTVSGPALAASAGSPPATAEKSAGLNGDGISTVRIEGNQRIESSTIQSYLGLRPGSPFQQSDIDAALKRLFATGFFADVKLLRSGGDLVVRVVENPVINRIAFEGNDRIETEDLEKELELKPRAIYTRTKVQNDVKRVLDIYRRSGRYSARIEPKVIALDQNRVDLVFEVEEGAVARVEKITFVGNKAFSERALTKAIRTEETRWYKFLTDDDKYDPDRLLYDQEMLRRLYVSQGYADFQVKSAHAELTPEKNAFLITFVIEEGDPYQFGSVAVESELKGAEKPDLTPVITTQEGEMYDATKVEDSIDAMVKELGNLGYAFVDVNPKVKRNKEARKIDLTYVIQPGPRVYVERIAISGNVRTLDEVIRREFRIAEGDPYNTSKIARSEQRLKNLGFFETVKITNEPGSAPDRTVVNVEVEEKSTGEINIGAGYSTTDGVLGDFGIRETNLLGRGQDLRFRTTYASRRKQAEISFTEPFFLNRELAAGFDVFRSQQEFLRESSHNIDSKGFILRAAYALKEKLQHSVNYTLRENDITDVRADASRFIRDQAGKNSTSAVGHALTYDDRNNKFDPTDGYYLRFSQDLAGLGGESKYVRHEVKGSYYYPVAKQWTLGFAASGGHIFGLGEDVRINDRFFIGGQDLRGFRTAGIGPRDRTTRDALGGNVYYTGSSELRFPLGLPDELGIMGAAFVDAGNLWHVEETGPDVFDSDSLRAAAGVGVSWSSPFGPIRVDFSHPFMKENLDRIENFRFSFGTRF